MFHEIALALGVQLADLVGILIFFGGWIFLAKDLKIGLIYYLLAFALGFVVFDSLGWPTRTLLLGTFISFLFMVLSVYISPGRTTAA